jgi:hypothetical protein
MVDFLHMFKKCKLKRHETICPFIIGRITRKIVKPVILPKNLVSRACQCLKNIAGERVK